VQACIVLPLGLVRQCVSGVARHHGDAIISEIIRNGFTVLADARARLSTTQAKALFPGAASSDAAIAYLTSDDSICLALEKPGAIR
jgi:hypothetical protein